MNPARRGVIAALSFAARRHHRFHPGRLRAGWRTAEMAAAADPAELNFDSFRREPVPGPGRLGPAGRYAEGDRHPGEAVFRPNHTGLTRPCGSTRWADGSPPCRALETTRRANAEVVVRFVSTTGQTPTNPCSS